MTLPNMSDGKLPDDFKFPEHWGETPKRIANLFNADVKEFIAKLEKYDGSYIDKRFWESRFWKELKKGFEE